MKVPSSSANHRPYLLINLKKASENRKGTHKTKANSIQGFYVYTLNSSIGFF